MKKEYLNKELIGYDLVATIVPSLHDCYRLCKSLAVCKSLSYCKECGWCTLNYVDSSQVTSADFVAGKGVLFTDMNEWPANPGDSCKDNPCGEDRCFPTGESYICKTFEYCHHFEPHFGEINDTSTKVGTYIKLTCIEPDKKLYGNDVTHCQRNGYWSDYPYCWFDFNDG
ncbi:hypothetical protein ACF0H5_006382 [Mactra antiquata]